jgi:hypothetical protein
MRKLHFAIPLGLLAAGIAQADERSHTLVLYGLGIGIDGQATVGPLSADIDVPLSDILDHLEMAAMGSYRWDSDKWSFQADAIFASLAGESEGGLGLTRSTLDLDQLIVELDGGYKFTDRLELVFGARYWDIDPTIKVHASGTGNVIATAGGGNSWTDPLVGLRVVAPISDAWTFVARGDIGGFGVGSDFAWHVTAHFDWHTSDSFSVLLGWRILDVDFEDGGNNGLASLDLQEGGPAIGVAWSF